METIPIKWYIASSLFLYLLVGIKVYIVDRLAGVKLQRKKYDLTHDEPLAPEDEFGFIHNRRSGVKFTWAAIVATLTSIFLVAVVGTNPLVEIFTWFFDTLMVWLGFFLGPWAYQLWKGRNVAIEKLDEIQAAAHSGELKQELVEGAAAVMADARETGSNLAEAAGEKASELGAVAKDKIDDAAQKITGTRPLGTPADNAAASSDGDKGDSPAETPEESEETREELEGHVKRLRNRR